VTSTDQSEARKLVVIGGGPAGYVAAIRAAQLSASSGGGGITLLEEEELGGTCLNRGCIPTKTMVASAHLLQRSRRSKRLSLSGALDHDWSALVKRKAMVVGRLRKGIAGRLEQLGVEVLGTHARLEAPDLVVTGEGSRIRAENVLLSPGSLPLLPGPLGADGVLTSREVLDWEDLPESLIIVGGGVIGCEFASVFAAFGVTVTILEMLPAILPGVDEDVTQVVHRALVKLGVSIRTGHGATDVSVTGGRVEVTLDDGGTVSAERVLVAVGRKPRLDDLGLQECGVNVGPRGIEIDGDMRTSLGSVYAAGDATGIWQLAHAGSAQGLVAVDRMFGHGSRRLNSDAIPSCIFTDPEIAIVGPGEDELRERDVEYLTGYSRFIANGRAVGMNETEGFLKLIVEAESRRVLGVQIVGAEASSLVGEAVLAVSLGARVDAIAEAVHPHPTLSELFMEAAESLCEGAIHG
jgi:dihydrolipoamide dehydrogenase